MLLYCVNYQGARLLFRAECLGAVLAGVVRVGSSGASSSSGEPHPTCRLWGGHLSIPA